MQKALIIDDERLARNELKKLLLEFPEIEVVGEAANATEGLEKIENLSPDLIFLDIQMPGKQGNDLCKELKANPLTSNIPVIFLSGKDDAPKLAAESCADGCISKPFDSDMVIAEIERILAGPNHLSFHSCS